MESEGLRLDSLWVLRIFSLSHACDKTKTSFSKTYCVPIINGFTSAIYNIFLTNQGAHSLSVILPTFLQYLP